MSLRNRLILPVILAGLAVLAGCGNSTNSVTPPPSGSFSNTNFNGNYTFSVLGTEPGFSEFAMAGTITACGCAAGTISGGTVDYIDNTGSAPASTVGNNSTYNITKDGRGFARLMITTTTSVAFEVDMDFVLTSSSHGLISRFDGSGTGSGTIDLQTAPVTLAELANIPYAFSVAGSDQPGDPLSMMGAFTLDGSGNISTSGANAGVADATLYSFATGMASPYANMALSGSVQVGSGTAPGPATLTSSFGTLAFDVYPVDSTHLKIIESDGIEILAGDVYTQPSASIPAGTYVFGMAGYDPGENPFAAAGTVVSDGSSQFTSGAEDLNDNSVVDFGTNTPQPFSGGFVATGGGRFLVTLSTFDGGTSFAAYPSSGGIFIQEIDAGAGSGVTSGLMIAQTSGAALAASTGYGFNLSGWDLLNGIEVDEIAEFKTTSSGMSGLVDQNDGGSLGTSNFTGTYTPGTGGLGSALFSSGGLGSLFYYSIDNSNTLFLSTDSTVVALGSIQTQQTPTDSALQRQPVTSMMLRTMPHPRAKAPRVNKPFVRK